jgi:serine/threonine-protein kinase
MQEREPAQDSSEDVKVTGDMPTMAAEPAPTVPAVSGSRVRKAAVHDWTGREVEGRYKVLERIGEGGMGVVYVAEHLALKKKVAFKVILPQLAAHEELLLRFKREALATGQLDHPHIAAAIDFGELEDGSAFMVMPWVRGESLQANLEKNGALSYRRAASLCAQIADALSAAHAMGIVHRDLKPDNVLVEKRSDGSEAAKVLDFGVASLAGRSEGLSVDARPLTQAGTILGTPGYMSPEQATAGEVDHRTDLYALGVILWELCRGERLFEGSDITAIFAKQFNSVPPPLELGRSGMARELSNLVTRLLAWDKNQRPSSAAEVRDALRRIAELPDTTLSNIQVGLEALPQAWRRYLPQAIGGLVILVAILIAVADDKPETAPPEQQISAEAQAPAKPEKGKNSKVESAPKREQTPSAKAEAPQTKAEEPPAAEPAKGAATSLVQDQVTLLEDRNRDARRAAAKRVLESGEAAPRYLALLANLELARSCTQRKGALEEMRTLGDPRVLPALERMAATPRRGCGLLRLTDCLGCLRRELDETVTALKDAVGG